MIKVLAVQDVRGVLQRWGGEPRSTHDFGARARPG
jgi:hypothetical protein